MGNSQHAVLVGCIYDALLISREGVGIVISGKEETVLLHEYDESARLSLSSTTLHIAWVYLAPAVRFLATNSSMIFGLSSSAI